MSRQFLNLLNQKESCHNDFKPKSLTSARYEVETWNGDELPMVNTYHHTSPLQHMIQRERKKICKKERKINPYLEEFLNCRLCDEFQRRRAFCSWSQKSTLKKEVIEAMATMSKIKYQLRRNANELDESNLVFVDLCAGKGLLSIFITKQYPRSQVHMIDNNKKMVLTHLEATPKIQFHSLDIHSKDVSSFLKHVLQDGEKFLVLVGIHLCGVLSHRAIELYRQGCGNAKKGALLILCPCCLPHRQKRSNVYGHDVRRLSKSLGVSPYLLWCTHLHFDMKATNRNSSMNQDVDMAEDIQQATFLITCSKR